MMIKDIINYIKDDKFKIIFTNNSLDIINYDKLLDKLQDDELLIIGYIKNINLSR